MIFRTGDSVGVSNQIILKNHKFKKSIFLSLFVTILLVLSSMEAIAILSGTQVWNQNYNGPGNGQDRANAVVVDKSGNVYVTGYVNGGIASPEINIIKYNKSGVLQWEKQYGNAIAGTDTANSIALDKSNNVYITGRSTSPVSGDDIVTIKYDSAGNEKWVRRHSGSGNNDDLGLKVLIDSNGYAYIAGYTNNGKGDNFTLIKYSPTGTRIWVRNYNGPAKGNDTLENATIDNKNNIYLTGSSEGVGTSIDFATIKYSSSGKRLWIRRFDGTAHNIDSANAISVDADRNVFVTGQSFSPATDFDNITIKYNKYGKRKWIRRFSGAVLKKKEEFATSIACDKYGNAFVAGFYDTGTSSKKDSFVIKYDKYGDLKWKRRYNGTRSGDDKARALVVDSSGNAYITGSTLGKNSQTDFLTIKYNSLGLRKWIKVFDGPSKMHDEGTALALDPSSANVIVTGVMDPFAVSTEDMETIKYAR